MLALEETTSRRVGPELQIAPAKVNPKEAGEVLADRQNFAVMFGDFMNFTNELFGMVQDAYSYGMVKNGGQALNVIGVHKDWLTEDGKARRIMVYNHGTGEFREMELEEPVTIARALTLYASKKDHEDISAELKSRNIEEVNPYEASSAADNKSRCAEIFDSARIATPVTHLIKQGEDIGSKVFAATASSRQDTFVIQPNTGTEGEQTEAFNRDEQGAMEQHVQGIHAADDAIVREYRGNVRYSEDGGETSYACVFRTIVSYNKAEGRHTAQAGYLQVAGKPEDKIAAVSRGGRIVEFPDDINELLGKLYVPSADGKLASILSLGGMAIDTFLTSLQTEPERAVRELGLVFTGIDVSPEVEVIKGGLKVTPYILDANPRPAGLTHARPLFGPVSDNKPMFTFWETKLASNAALESAKQRIDSETFDVSDDAGRRKFIAFVEGVITDRELSDNFQTHYAVDELVNKMTGLGPSRAELDKAIAGILGTLSTRIIGADLNVPVQSLFDLIGDSEIKKRALVDLIHILEDYTNRMDAGDPWVFDESSRAMRFISAVLDELNKIGGRFEMRGEGMFLGSALKKFGKKDKIIAGLIRDIGKLKEKSDVIGLARAYEKIVPRLINLKVMHFYEAKYGKPQAGEIPGGMFNSTVEVVTFPIGISYSRCAWDNLGRVPRSSDEDVRYLLAGIKFLDSDGREIDAGKVTVKRLTEPKLILHAKSYDEKGNLARIEYNLDNIDPKVFFDYKDLRFRLLKDALVVAGIVKEDSDNIGGDIKRFTQGGGLEVTVNTVVPGGTGLGTSGAVATALLTAFDRIAGKEASIDSELGDRSVYLEHRLTLGSGMQDWRRPVEGPNSFKIYHQPGGPGFPSARPEFLTTVDVKKAQQQLVLFYPGFKRQATGRLNTVLSGHLSRDRNAFQAMLDVIKLQDRIEEAFKDNDFETVGRLSEEYRKYREIMDPTTEGHILKAIGAMLKAPGIWGGAFTGSPGGVIMIWCPAEKKQDVIRYLERLKDDPELTYEDKPIFGNAKVLNPVFSNEGYKVNIVQSQMDDLDSLIETAVTAGTQL